MCGGGDTDIANTESQKALATVAAGKWQQYQDVYVPAQDKFIEDVQELGGQKAMDEATNVAGVSSNAVTSGAISDTAKAMASSNINPNSTQFKQGIEGTKTNAGVSASNNANSVQIAQQNRYLTGLDSVNAMGTEQEASAISGMGDLAESSFQDSVSDYQSSVQNSQGVNQIIGAGVGAATRSSIG